jgi:hypothetical protein
MFDAACLLGAWVLGQPAPPFDRTFWADPFNWLIVLWPLAVGCLPCAIACSALGYFGVRLARGVGTSCATDHGGGPAIRPRPPPGPLAPLD